MFVNAGTKDKDFSWLLDHLKDDAAIEDITDETAKIDIQGPASEKIIKKIFDPGFISSLERFYFDYTVFNGKKNHDFQYRVYRRSRV